MRVLGIEPSRVLEGEDGLVMEKLCKMRKDCTKKFVIKKRFIKESNGDVHSAQKTACSARRGYM